jgi:dipeptidyl aminopeptidase/acylaminoacyl peptidase
MRWRTPVAHCLILIFAHSAWAAANTAPTKISPETFAKFDSFSNPVLSPTGNRIVARFTQGGKRRISILDLAKPEAADSMQVLGEGKADVRWYRWANDQTILLGVASVDYSTGYPLPVSRVMAYDIAGRSFRQLGPKTLALDGDTVLYVAPDGSHMLLAASKRLYTFPAVYRVDIATNATTVVVQPKPNVYGWFADTAGVVRGGIGIAGKKFWLLYRDDANAEFETIYRDKLDDSDGEIESVRFATGRDRAYVISNAQTGRFGLYEFDLATRQPGKAVFEHPKVDLDTVLWSGDSEEIDGVTYVDDRFRVKWFNPSLKALQASIDKALAGHMNWVVSRNRDDTRLIVWSGSATNPGTWYLLDRKTRRMDTLGFAKSWIDPATMADMESVTYAARDGLEIPAYLTLPRGRAPRGLPLIVMPHGGPFTRDSWEYSAEVQFLANRGYAVLQPNYRGSTGYGRAYVEKGYGEYGRKIQDDIDDGVAWLAAKGIADDRRVCIVGASYGGYAALLAATRNARSYRCAVSFAGISDMKKMLQYDRRFLSPRRYRKWREDIVLGDKALELDTISPIKATASANTPVLLFHGEQDGRVPIAQSREFVNAMKKAGRASDLIVYKDEGHGFSDEANFADYLTRIDAFLTKHNPAD